MNEREREGLRKLQNRVLQVLHVGETSRGDWLMPITQGLPTCAEVRDYLYPEHRDTFESIVYEMTGKRS